MPETTRRKVLLSGAGALAGFAGVDTASGTQKDSARWDIGLPLEKGWSVQFNRDYFPVGITSDFQLVILSTPESSTGIDRLHLVDLATGKKARLLRFQRKSIMRQSKIRRYS